jgi:bifunctional DNA-binding transcriptional regulator/antitoxin component of YhaV-PrlF toxin-antitoxin module
MKASSVASIDSAGGLVISKWVREQTQLVPGQKLRIEVVDGRVEIEPADGLVPPAHVLLETYAVLTRLPQKR